MAGKKGKKGRVKTGRYPFHMYMTPPPPRTSSWPARILFGCGLFESHLIFEYRMGDQFLSSAGTERNCASPMRLPDPNPVLDKNRAPMGPEILSSTGAGVWRKAPMAFSDSSSVLDQFQSATEAFNLRRPPAILLRWPRYLAGFWLTGSFWKTHQESAISTWNVRRDERTVELGRDKVTPGKTAWPPHLSLPPNFSDPPVYWP